MEAVLIICAVALAVAIGASALTAGYIELSTRRPNLLGIWPWAISATGTVLWTFSLAALIGGTDGQVVAGALAPVVFLLQLWIWLEAQQEVGEIARIHAKSAGDEPKGMLHLGAGTGKTGEIVRARKSALAVRKSDAGSTIAEPTICGLPGARPGRLRLPWRERKQLAASGADRRQLVEPEEEGQDGKQTLPVAEAAAELGIGQATVRTWAKRGILDAAGERPLRLRRSQVAEVAAKLEELRAAGVAKRDWAQRLARD